VFTLGVESEPLQRAAPPQTIICVPVQTADAKLEAAGPTLEVGVHVFDAGSYRPPVLPPN
jgi:hypothetical protein